ncbi:MAG: DUF4143 domain-containing protein, partial [Candidatus Eisenbacteria bacterium]|nr:DUF4143 domain-containing protein [Candidatus Eisenbacteria bacterium]
YESLKATREIQRDLLETYMGDIAKHSGKTNALHIERLWRNVTHQLARSQDGSTSKFKFKDAVPGIRGYDRLASPMDWLEKANLTIRTSIIERAETPLRGFSKENRFKQYFFDVGLLGAFSDIEPVHFLDFDFKTYKGYVAENFVAQEFRASGIQNLYCWVGRMAEIEFLIEAAFGIVPIEVKSGNVTRSKSLNVYEERYSPQKSIVLSARNIESRNPRIHVPIYLAGAIKNHLMKRETP